MSQEPDETPKKGLSRRDALLVGGTAAATGAALWVADRFGFCGGKKSPKNQGVDAGVDSPDASSDLDNIVDASTKPKPDNRPVYEIDISDSFVPWPISLAPYAKTFRKLRKSRRDYTIYGVNPAMSNRKVLRQARNFQKLKANPDYVALKELDVSSFGVIGRNFTTYRDVRRETYLKKAAKKEGFAYLHEFIKAKELDPKYERSIRAHKRRANKLAIVKDIQKRLKLEGLYRGKVDGNYNWKTFSAVKKLQSRNGLKLDGAVGRGTAKWLSPKYREKLECRRVQNLVEERVFYSTWVLNRGDMKNVMKQANKQLGLENIEGVVSFLEKNRRGFKRRGTKLKLKLDVPENYKVKEMKLEGIIYKKRGRRNGKKVLPEFRLYQIYKGADGKERKIELYRVNVATGGYNLDFTEVIKARENGNGDAVVGGPDPNKPNPNPSNPNPANPTSPDAGVQPQPEPPVPKPKRKLFPTPTGTVYWKMGIVAPAWNPPSWDDPDTKEVALKPGIHNAYGLLMFPFFTKPEVPEKYRKKLSKKGMKWADYHYSADLYSKTWIGIKAHSTGSPRSIARGGSSHGCVRYFPPEAMRLFPFVMNYSRLMPTSKEAKFRNPDRGQLIVPFEKGSYVKIDVVNQLAPRK